MFLFYLEKMVKEVECKSAVSVSLVHPIICTSLQIKVVCQRVFLNRSGIINSQLVCRRTRWKIPCPKGVLPRIRCPHVRSFVLRKIDEVHEKVTLLPRQTFPQTARSSEYAWACTREATKPSQVVLPHAYAPRKVLSET